MSRDPDIAHWRPDISEGDVAAVVAALRAGHLSTGVEVAALEREVSDMLGGLEVVGVSSGTAGLYLSLVAVGVGPGDRVVIPSYTCNSLYAATAYAGADAICADLPEAGLSLSPETVAAAAEGGACAVIAPHTLGFLADVPGLVAAGHTVIEDATHALGGRYADGREVGTVGAVAVVSLGGSKLVPAGCGGVCMTSDSALAARMRDLRLCDERPPTPRAFNLGMSDLSGALALSRIRGLREHVACRDALASRYDAVLGEHSWRRISDQRQAVCFRYLVDAPGGAEAFVSAANAAGIACRRPVYRPLHETLGGRCPVAARRHERVVSVPLYPGLSGDDVALVLAGVTPLL